MKIERKTTAPRLSTIAYRLKLRAARKLLEDAGLSPVGEQNEKAAIARTLNVIREAQDRGELPLLSEDEVEGLATKYAMDLEREPGDQLAALRLVAEIKGQVGKTAMVLHGKMNPATEQALSDRELDRMLADEERKLPPAIDVTPIEAAAERPRLSTARETSAAPLRSQIPSSGAAPPSTPLDERSTAPRRTRDTPAPPSQPPSPSPGSDA